MIKKARNSGSALVSPECRRCTIYWRHSLDAILDDCGSKEKGKPRKERIVAEPQKKRRIGYGRKEGDLSRPRRSKEREKVNKQEGGREGVK